MPSSLKIKSNTSATSQEEGGALEEAESELEKAHEYPSLAVMRGQDSYDLL